ncbi:hypothetical protein [Paenibacillus sp. SI8]|uniref:hypothetical protein n=1 Tax=Paenibacillus sp. SI8 TaxID=3163026 RepID=UPI0034652093
MAKLSIVEDIAMPYIRHKFLAEDEMRPYIRQMNHSFNRFSPAGNAGVIPFIGLF